VCVCGDGVVCVLRVCVGGEMLGGRIHIHPCGEMVKRTTAKHRRGTYTYTYT
jgi:hypothetical protein